METKIQPQNNISNSYNTKKRMVAVTVLILLVAVAILVWYMVRSRTTKQIETPLALSPIETLKALDTASPKEIPKPRERIIELKNLEKKSKPVSVTDEDRVKLLEKLNTVQ